MTDTSHVRDGSGDGYIRLSGDLDVVTVPQVAADVIKAVRAARGVMTVDVADVMFVDSAGVGLLADVLALGTARGQAIVLEGASHRLHKLLLQCGIESLFSYR